MQAARLLLVGMVLLPLLLLLLWRMLPWRWRWGQPPADFRAGHRPGCYDRQLLG
jgi:hypothetical protein